MYDLKRNELKIPAEIKDKIYLRKKILLYYFSVSNSFPTDKK